MPRSKRRTSSTASASVLVWLRWCSAPQRIAPQSSGVQRSHEAEVRIRFVGVWDTVDAVGLPFHLADVLNSTVHRFKFPDYRLSPSVDRACHALALDDERHSFSPLLWEESAESGRADRAGLVRRRALQRRRRLPQTGPVARCARLDADGSRACGSAVRRARSSRQPERAGAVSRARQRRRQAVRSARRPRRVLPVEDPRHARALPGEGCDAGVAPERPRAHRARHRGLRARQPGAGRDRGVHRAGSRRGSGALSQRAANVHAVLDGLATRPREAAARHEGCPAARRDFVLRLPVTCTAVLLAAAGGTTCRRAAEPARDPARASDDSSAGCCRIRPGQLLAVGRTLAEDRSLAGWLVAGFLLAYVLSLVADRRMSAWFSGFWYRPPAEAS